MNATTQQRQENRADNDVHESLGFRHFAAYAAPHGFSVNDLPNGHWQAKQGRWNANYYRASGKIVLQGPQGFNKVVQGSYRQAIDALVELTQAAQACESPASGTAAGIGSEAEDVSKQMQMQQEECCKQETAAAQDQQPTGQQVLAPIPGETIEQASFRTKDAPHRVFVETQVHEMHLAQGEVLVPNLFPFSQEFLDGRADGLVQAVTLIRDYGPEKAVEIITGQLARFRS
jgi:hypothetical protein